jgi:tetratricopeptide (TPR) repeat protein
MKEKFDSRRYAKASHLNTVSYPVWTCWPSNTILRCQKLLNNCHTEEDIDLGVEAIKGFRSSLSKIQISTGAAVVRACCRAGVADKALEIMKNKIEYGVFFSKSAYDYLIQYFYEKKEYERAVEAYELLLNDEEEIQPLWKTFHTAVQACCFLGTVDGIRRALELNKLSRKRNLFMRIRLYHSLGTVACQLSDPDLCLEIMKLMTEELNIRFSRAQTGLVIRARIMKGDYREAVEALELLPVNEQFEVLPHSTLNLVEVVSSSTDEHLQRRLKDILDKLSSAGKKMPNAVRQTDDPIKKHLDDDRLGGETAIGETGVNINSNELGSP